MKRRTDRKKHRPLGPFRFRNLSRAIDRRFGSRNNNLTWRIVIRDDAHWILLSLRSTFDSFPCGGFRSLEIGPEQSAHCALADRSGFLHGTPALPEKPCRISKFDSASGAQGGVFSEGMARNDARVQCDVQTPLTLQHAHNRHACRHNSRLRVLRQDEIGFRSLPHQLTEVLPERFVNLLKKFTCRCKCFGDGFPHANRLAALPRKDERTRHAAADKSRPVAQVKQLGRRRRTFSHEVTAASDKKSLSPPECGSYPESSGAGDLP